MGDEADYRIEQMTSGRWSCGPYIKHKKSRFIFPKGDTPMGSHKTLCVEVKQMGYTVTKPALAVEGLHGVLYGEPKTGKTSTLDDPVFKVLLLDLEGGSAVLSEAENVDRIPIVDEIDPATGKVTKFAFQTFIEVMKDVESGELTGYDLYAIDSMTQFEEAVKNYIVHVFAPMRNGRPSKEKFMFGGQQDWGDLKTLIIRMVKWIHGMTKRGEKSIHVLWIAHIADKKENIPGTDEQRVVGKKIALQGGNTAEVVMSIVDAIFYMFNREVKDGETTKLWRGIATKPRGVIPAMARQSKKRDPLPDLIGNPVWSEIFETLGYTKRGDA